MLHKALEIEKLKLQIAKLRRMQFGRSSERITRQIKQLELRLEELQAGEAEEVAAKAKSPMPMPMPPNRWVRSASAASRSASRYPIICHARRSCINRPMTALANALTAARAWPSLERT